MIGLGLNLYTRPPIGSLSAYFAAISPSATVRTAYTTFFNSLVTAGIYPKIGLLYPMVLDTDAASRINAITPGAHTLTDVGTAPTWVTGVGGAGGFTPNGAALNTGWKSSGQGAPMFTLNSATILIDSATSGLSTNRDWGDSSRHLGCIRTTADAISYRMNDGTTGTVGTTATGAILLGITRPDSTNRLSYINGTLAATVAVTSVSVSSTDMYVGGNNGGTVGARRLRLFAVGGAFDAADHSNFATAWTQFKTDIGCT